MRRFFLVTFFLLFLMTLARAQGGGPPIRVTESDGSPAAYPVRRINFPNGTLSCTGSTCTYSGGASGFVSNPSLTSTDNALARFDGTGGVTLQNSTLIVDDTGNVTLGGGATAGELRFLEPSGGGSSYTGFISPALAANVVYTLPTADGSANQVLSTNGSKVLSWVTASSGISTVPLLNVNAAANQPPASAFATLDSRNSHSVLDFDASTDEDAIFASVLPTSYSGNGITVTIVWAAASATSGDCVWVAAWEALAAGGQDIDSDGFAAGQTTTTTTNGTSGVLNYTVITFTNGAQIDSLAAGSAFRLKVTRDANAGGDTMTGDAQLLRVFAVETP